MEAKIKCAFCEKEINYIGSIKVLIKRILDAPRMGEPEYETLFDVTMCNKCAEEENLI